ncbi:hypothetical protein SpCBS45565_g08308 [Spizellomyces sp. 'palustris']|nr:hypothetical protein SpCBS45565_g08308 [Spizellomyces sp. 'palustris']
MADERDMRVSCVPSLDTFSFTCAAPSNVTVKQAPPGWATPPFPLRMYSPAMADGLSVHIASGAVSTHSNTSDRPTVPFLKTFDFTCPPPQPSHLHAKSGASTPPFALKLEPNTAGHDQTGIFHRDLQRSIGYGFGHTRKVQKLTKRIRRVGQQGTVPAETPEIAAGEMGARGVEDITDMFMRLQVATDRAALPSSGGPLLPSVSNIPRVDQLDVLWMSNEGGYEYVPTPMSDSDALVDASMIPQVEEMDQILFNPILDSWLTSTGRNQETQDMHVLYDDDFLENRACNDTGTASSCAEVTADDEKSGSEANERDKPPSHTGFVRPLRDEGPFMGRPAVHEQHHSRHGRPYYQRTASYTSCEEVHTCTKPPQKAHHRRRRKRSNRQTATLSAQRVSDPSINDVVHSIDDVTSLISNISVHSREDDDDLDDDPGNQGDDEEDDLKRGARVQDQIASLKSSFVYSSGSPNGSIVRHAEYEMGTEQGADLDLDTFIRWPDEEG